MMERSRRRVRRALVVAAACAALPVAPTAALASTSQQSVIEDEHQMLDLGPQAQAAALDDAVALGADIVRINVFWSRYAPSPNAKKKPKGFDGANPAAYPAGVFGPLDGAVAGAQQRGLQVLLTPTGPIPAWASGCGGAVSARHTCKPNPQLFGAFVRALGKRYPTVKLWSIWNEPNQKSWLSPQYVASGTRPVLYSAALYRSLATSAIAGLRGTGHRSDQILLGETAPLGRDPSVCALESSKHGKVSCIGTLFARPQDFLRGVFCLKSNGHKLTGAQATEQHCGHYKRLSVTGYAHHPYTRGGFFPPIYKNNPGEITIGTLSRLTTLLDQAARAKRIPSHLPVFYTENGWQTNAPAGLFGDPNGVLPDQQATYINQADWIAYRNSRVKTVAQYLLVDAGAVNSFQSGLRYLNGTPKPAYAAYQLPIWVSGKGSTATVYGQVRPAPDGAALQVEIQHAASASGAFQTVQVVPVTSQKGQFKVNLPSQAGVWRLRWNGLTSRVTEMAAS
jgi:hypothetical protein